MFSTSSSHSSQFHQQHTRHDHFLSIPWLQKKKSNWSLRSFTKTRQGSISTASIAISVTSGLSCTDSYLAESMVTLPEPIEEEEEPPHYEDPSHPWIFRFPKSMANRQIAPREEEGNEVLPGYSCDIDKTAFLHVKCECSQPDVRSRDRSWRDFYVRIYGTQMMAYHRDPKKKPNAEPIWVYSMQGAEVTIPTDYHKYRYVARLRIHQGPQFLFTTQTEQERNDWIRAIESSIHVSSDLDSRTMPQFVTLSSRRRRRRPRPTEYQETLV